MRQPTMPPIQISSADPLHRARGQEYGDSPGIGADGTEIAGLGHMAERRQGPIWNGLREVSAGLSSK
jgi:hypothetical protein